MQVTRYRTFTDLAHLRAGWNRLAGDNPFLTWEWMHAWWNGFHKARELYILVVTEKDSSGKDQLSCIAPWQLRLDPVKGRWIKFLGAGVACSDYLGLLSEPRKREQSCRALRQWLTTANEAGDRPGDKWDFLGFDGVGSDPALKLLTGMLEQAGHGMEQSNPLFTWRHEIQQPWDEFVSSRGSRSNRRKLRSLKTKYIDSGRTCFQFAENQAQFEAFYASFVDLHQGRRQSLGESGVFYARDFTDFLRAACEELFQSDRLLLSQLKIDGQVAAAGLGIIGGRTQFLYQTGLQPQLAHQNPGWLMNIHNILGSQERGLEIVDYLRGDEPYKAWLATSRVRLKKYRVVSKCLSAKLRNCALLTLTRGLSIVKPTEPLLDPASAPVSESWAP